MLRFWLETNGRKKNERKVPLQSYKTKRNIYTNPTLGKPWFGTIWPRAITSLMKIRATKSWPSPSLRPYDETLYHFHEKTVSITDKKFPHFQTLLLVNFEPWDITKVGKKNPLESHTLHRPYRGIPNSTQPPLPLTAFVLSLRYKMNLLLFCSQLKTVILSSTLSTIPVTWA